MPRSDSLELRTMRTFDMDELTRECVVRLCIDAHHEEDLRNLVDDCEIACLETDRPAFYERLGWEEWRGSLGGRSAEGLIPTPDQSGVMILRLARTPKLDTSGPLTIEAHPARMW
jgi:aminoglycoside 2'-N-acetyltransferase I